MSSNNPEEPSGNIDDVKDDIKEAIIEALTDGVPTEAFCKNWPAAKAALEELLKKIPSANISLRACIKGVIFAGDTFFAKCPKEA